MRIIAFFIIGLGLTVSTELYSQEVRYIRDTLHVPLRSGQSTRHKILHRGLISGTALTVLEQNEDKTYSKVKTPGGMEGWIQNQYLSKTPSARKQLKSAQATITKLQNEQSALQQQFKQSQDQQQKLQQTTDALTLKSGKLEKELANITAISAKAIQLNSDNEKLRLNNQELSNKLDVLSTDNQRLHDDSTNEAFLNGAFAVLIGVFITLIVPRLRRSKPSDWA